jgi:hypothetical protein
VDKNEGIKKLKAGTEAQNGKKIKILCETFVPSSLGGDYFNPKSKIQN